MHEGTREKDMTRVITEQVSIPEERQAEFHRWFARWLEGPNSNGTDTALGVVSGSGESIQARRGERWRTGNRDDLSRDARCLYNSISPLAKQILDYWLDHDPQRHSAEVMVHQLGLKSTKALAGSTNSFTRKGKDCGGRGLPFHWTEREDGTVYWMDEDIRDLFITARLGTIQ